MCRLCLGMVALISTRVNLCRAHLCLILGEETLLHGAVSFHQNSCMLSVQFIIQMQCIIKGV